MIELAQAENILADYIQAPAVSDKEPAPCSARRLPRPWSENVNDHPLAGRVLSDRRTLFHLQRLNRIHSSILIITG